MLNFKNYGIFFCTDDWCDAEGSPTQRASPERRLAAPPQAQDDSSQKPNQEHPPQIKPAKDISEPSAPIVQNISQEKQSDEPQKDSIISRSVPDKVPVSDTVPVLDNVSKNLDNDQKKSQEKTQDVADKKETEIKELSKTTEKKLETHEDTIETAVSESQKGADSGKVDETEKPEAVPSRDLLTKGDHVTVDVIPEELKTRDKGDMVVVGASTPTSSHSDSSNGNGKGLISLLDTVLVCCFICGSKRCRIGKI